MMQKRIISFVLVLVMLLSLFSCVTLSAAAQQADETALSEVLSNKTKLRFGEDGKFKVLVLPDAHVYRDGLTAEQQAVVQTMVDKEQPDLVILTGDNVRGTEKVPVRNEADFRTALDSLVGYLETKGIYWMHVYGNHDEQNNPLTLEQQQAIYEEYAHCLSKDSVESLNGVGNYVVPLYGSDTSKDEIKFAFWGLDSGSQMSAEELARYFPDGSVTSSYDFIHEDQVQWYKDTSAVLENSVGAKVPGLMAFHIPLNEYETAWNNRADSVYSDDKNEGVSQSKYNGGMYAAIAERGDIVATVCGHDHDNTFMVEYGGVKLCYSGKISTNGYHREDCMGGRVFVINEEEPAQVDTYMSYLVDRGPQYLEDGYTFDFEQETELTVGYKSTTPEANRHDTVYAELVGGKGVDGSRALATCRTEWGANKTEQNVGLKWNLPTAKRLGDNQYLLVWMDLQTSDIDFRKASFGLLSEGESVFCTDNYGSGAEFYYMADGTYDWVTKTMGSDGCFGTGDDCSVKGLKGWFAFKIEHMVNDSNSLTKESAVSGFYLYYSPAASDQVNKPAYIDNVMLVKDYRTAIEDPYAKVTGTVNADGYIVPDGNVLFLFAKQPSDASSDGFAYTYPGNGKTYWLKWNTNAVVITQNTLKYQMESKSKAWANDTTGTVSRDLVFVMAPGTYGAFQLQKDITISTRAASGANPTVDQLFNVYFLGAKAGVSPVSADRSTKEAAKKVVNGRSTDPTKETVINNYWRFPWRCNVTFDGFTGISAFSFFTQQYQVNVNVTVKNHYVTNLTTSGHSSAVMYTRADSRGMYTFENAYFDMRMTTLNTGFAGFYVNKLTFDNCAFVNEDTSVKSQTMVWYPYNASDVTAYKNFLGQYATNPTYRITDSIFADWADSSVVKIALGSRSGSYATNACKFEFSGNAVFDCGQVTGNSSVVTIAPTADADRINDYEITMRNNTFSFSDEVFGMGATGNSYAMDLGAFTSAAVGGKITFTGNTFSVPADGKTQVFTGVNHDCTGWTRENNVYQTNAGELLELSYPIQGHVEGKLIIDTPPTATAEGVGHTECTKCGEIKKYVLTAGEAQIGEEVYASLGEALSAAQSGDAVVLRGDAEEEYVSLHPGVTLDLNGRCLTSEYVVGFKSSAIIDGSADNSGKLIADKTSVALDKDNQGYIPVYDGDGYVFTTIGLMGRSAFVSADKFMFSPVFETFVHEALNAGRQNSGIEVLIRLKWKRDGNYDGVQEFIYLDEMVQQVIDSYAADKFNYGLAFLAEFSGKEAEGNPEIEVSAVIRSATGAELDTSTLEFDEDNIVLSFGALSDSHIRTLDASTAEADNLRNALEQLKAQAALNDSDGLDAVAWAGDLTDMGRTVQADVFIDIVKEAGIDTALLTFGNHDYYSHRNQEASYDPAYLTYYAEQLGDIFTANATDMSLIEKGAYHSVVNGSHFIMIQPATEDLMHNQNFFPYDEEVLAWLDDTLAKITAADPSSYVFLFTHIPTPNTTYDTHKNWQNYVTKYLDSTIKKYPQVVMFTGHLHGPQIDERSIMQTDYTSVHVSCTKNLPAGYLVQVDAHGNVRMTRMWFSDNTTIKEPWVIIHPTADNAHLDAYSKETRLANNTAPKLSGELKTTVTTTATETGFTAKVNLSFGLGEDDDFVNGYKVTATNLKTGAVQSFDFITEAYRLGDPADIAAVRSYDITLECTETAEYTIDVVAVDCWDAQSNKLSCDLTVTAPSA